MHYCILENLFQDFEVINKVLDIAYKDLKSQRKANRSCLICNDEN
jgi:hypothetical protein